MNMGLSPQDWATLRPIELLTAVGLLATLLSAFWRDDRAAWVGWVSILGMAVCMADLMRQWGSPVEGFGGTLALDGFTVFFGGVFLMVAIFTLAMSIPYLQRIGLQHGEYYALLVFATLGGLLMAESKDLILTFLGLETLSLAVYVLAGFARSRMESTEASLKYFLLGAFASGFLLYGIALLFGATGSTRLTEIARAISVMSATSTLAVPRLVFIAAVLLGVGFAFKVAAVPFHMWTPDVYEGAPLSVTAYMAAAVKAAGFAAFARVFWIALGPLTPQWGAFLGVSAVFTMTWGNIVAIQQKNIKRMLAYSSIAHAGYLLVAMVAGGASGQSALLFYFVPYALMNLGAFTLVSALQRQGGGDAVRIDDLAGLAGRSPWLALAMSIFMFSLAGIPPTAGFIGKFYIFRAAVESGHMGLAIVGVLNSVISVYYYLRPVVAMYMQEGGENAAVPETTPVVHGLLFLAIAGLLIVGVLPGGLYAAATASVQGVSSAAASMTSAVGIH